MQLESVSAGPCVLTQPQRCTCKPQRLRSGSQRLPAARKVLRAKSGDEQGPGEGQSGHHELQGQIKQLTADDPETLDRLERVRKAAALVAGLQAQKAELDRRTTAANYASAWETQDQERQQAQEAAERGADLDILRAADTLEIAQSELTAAMSEQGKWSSVVNEESERVESGKAGAVAAAGSAAGSLPFIVASSPSGFASFASLAAVLVTGLLFGVTYRYAIRRDIGNVQLKGGVLAAFGLARGLALAEEILKAGGGTPSLASAAAAAGESMLSVGFAAAAIELAFQKGFVKPFSQT